MSAAQTGGEAPCWACRFHAAPREHALWRSLLGCSSEFQTDGRRAQAWLRRAQAWSAQRIVPLPHTSESAVRGSFRSSEGGQDGPWEDAGYAGGPFAYFSTTRPLLWCARTRHTIHVRCTTPTCTASRLSPRVDRKTPPRPAARRGRSCRRWQCRRSSGSTIQSWLRAPRPCPCAGPPRRRQRRGCRRPPSTT